MALVMFAALTIDTLQLSTSHSQEQQSGEYLALAALEAFFKLQPTSITPTDQYQERLQAALDRAEQIGGLNFVIAGSQQQTTQSGQLAYEDGQSVSGGSGDAGTLYPGKWWFVEPTITCASYQQPQGQTCPCNGGVWKGACFTANAATELEVSAFRVELKTPQASPLRLVFAPIFGQSSISVRSSATAAKVPKRGVFLVDTSASTVISTHLDDSPDTRTKFAYELLGPSGCPVGKICSCPVDGAVNPCPIGNIAADATLAPCTFAGTHERFYNGYTDPVSGVFYDPLKNLRLQSTPPTTHFKSDYACFQVPYTSNGVSYSEDYLVDTQWWDTNPGPNYYDGPEPLNTILFSINSALQEFEGRSVKGDYVGAVFFDDRVDIDQRIFNLAQPGDPSFAELDTITDTSDPSDMNVKLERIKRMIFPRRLAYTNIPAALTKAVNMLTSLPDYAIAVNFIVLFSDGLTNCYKTGATYACNNNYQHWSNSTWYNSWSYINGQWILMNGTYEIIQTALQPQKIALHTVLIGDYVGPHSIVATSGDDPTKCIDESEIRNRLSSGTGWGSNVQYYDNSWWTPNPTTAYDAMSPTTPFTGPNYFWYYSQMTNGGWFPLRGCCQKNGACADVSADLNAACAARPPTFFNLGGKPYLLQQPFSVPPYSDSYGRLLCDPLGRSQKAQVQAYMTQVMQDSPYILVQ